MESSTLEAPRESRKTCQIEGCNELTVGYRTSLCRKHRNNKYKQNYKKKKRKAQGLDDMPSEAIENNLAEEKCFMEQKYASMLQQVLVQKQLELLQSEKVVQILRNHQQKVKDQKVKEIQERRKVYASLREQQRQDDLSVLPSISTSNASESSDCSRVEPSLVLAKNCKIEPRNAIVVKATKNYSAAQIIKNSGKQPARKNVGRPLHVKGERADNSTVVPGGKTLVTQQPQQYSTMSVATRVSSSLGKSSLGYNKTNIYNAKNSQQRARKDQTVCMDEQQNCRKTTVYSYPSSDGNSGTFTRACIDSVKQLCITACGKSFSPVSSMVSSSVSQPMPLVVNFEKGSCSQETSLYPQQYVMASSTTNEHVYTAGLEHGRLSNPVTCKAVTPTRNIMLEVDERQNSLASCTSVVAASMPGNIVSSSIALTGVSQQGVMSFPVTTFSSAAPPCDQTFAVGMNMTHPQTGQGVLSQNWSNQRRPGRLRSPATHEDFLLQVLQGGKDAPDEDSSTSQSSVIGRLDDVIPDTPWAISIGM